MTLAWGDLLPKIEHHTPLADRFVIPPFSVLDTRQGEWQERRRAWLTLGIQSEIGRSGKLISNATERHGMGGDYDLANGENAWGGSGTSIFDPVLCELVYRWFCPSGGSVLDPFAGGSVRGIVASRLGHPYTGIDLSQLQVQANVWQGEQIGVDPLPTWIAGDSAEVLPTLTGQSFDLIFTCPPYYDLEVYSDHPADLSNASTFAEFTTMFGRIISRAAERLNDGRFMVLVVSEVRDAQGLYHGLVPGTVMLAREAGLRLYNDAILVNSAGSLPLRVGQYMEATRKLGRCHQNVLVFLKGAPPRGWSYERGAPPDPQLGMF